MGLSLARLLTGLAQFVQHPHRAHICLVHLGWVAFLFFSVMHFWWFEFALAHVRVWTFEFYLFQTCYAALFFFICTVLFPDSMGEYSSYADYFHSRRRWFYGLLASLFAIDLFDTLWKGATHFHALGWEYPIRQGIMIAFCLIAMLVEKERYHQVGVILMLATQIYWILHYYRFLP